MAMTPSAIRFEPEEKSWIAAFAEMNGTTFSAQVRQWTLERLEDEMDARDLQMAIDEDDGSRTSWQDAKRDLGLA
ncbi:type II toxin-antitoxin system RelB family antitoxin [Adlercreutzia equolifaciens]|uniref:type II toxin-antitoxin system RelB family antitoxin n=1 Tax=Adlercreutzia equolifaciens TaxID=446660 RepID=UPI003AEFE17A